MLNAVIALAIVAAAALDGTWLLAFEGQSTAAALNDRRLMALVKDRVPIAVSGRTLVGLAVNSEPVLVAGGRFVSLSGCRASDCLENGFLWVDTGGGEALGAAYLASPRRDVLTIGSNGLVEFIGPSNLSTTMDPEIFRLHTPHA